MDLATPSLRALFALASRAPWTLDAMRPLAVRGALLASPQVRRATAANAARIHGKALPPRAARQYGRAVIDHFYRAVTDAGRQLTLEDLQARVEHVEGRDRYDAARSAKRGAVLVTLHLGSFEAGLAALRGAERRVHVVFKRDAFPAFERLRSRQRAALGVVEQPIDDGWPALMRLRDALRADEVVVMQGDRALPGQRAAKMPFLGGHLRMPTGPARLARLTGSPIIPVAAARGRGGTYRVYLGRPIEADDEAAAMQALAAALAKFVSLHPEQWLALSPAFAEDQPDAE